MSRQSDGAGRQILVVDDDLEIRECVVEVLRDEGYAATGAVNGREALALLAAAVVPPDLILLDLLMPVMDGAEFRREQLKDPHIAAIPTVIISANAQVREAAARLGVAAWLAKPLDLAVLLDAVEVYARRPGG